MDAIVPSRSDGPEHKLGCGIPVVDAISDDPSYPAQVDGLRDHFAAWLVETSVLHVILMVRHLRELLALLWHTALLITDDMACHPAVKRPGILAWTSRPFYAADFLEVHDEMEYNGSKPTVIVLRKFFRLVSICVDKFLEVCTIPPIHSSFHLSPHCIYVYSFGWPTTHAWHPSVSTRKQR